MKREILATILLSLILLPVRAADMEPFAFIKELVGEASQDALNTVILDEEVFRHTREGLPDLRLFAETEEGAREVPFEVARIEYRKVAATAERIDSEVVSFLEQDDGSISIEVKFENDSKFASALRVNTPLRDFQKNVKVYGLAGEGREGTLLVEGMIVDQERFLDYRRTTLELPENSFRRFRIVIAEATDRQRSLMKQFTKTVSDDEGKSVTVSESVSTRLFRIDSLAFYSEKGAKETSYSAKRYPVEVTETIENKEAGETEIYLDTHLAPLDTLTLVTDDENFSRRVEVQYLSNTDTWRRISRHKLFRFSLGDFQEEQLHCHFSEARNEKMRVVIQNGDSPPLSIKRVVGMGEAFEMRFFARNSDKLKIYFGSEVGNVKKPTYDLAAIRAASVRNFPKKALILDSIRENMDFERKGPRVSFLEKSWFLWVVIVLVVAGLVFALTRTASQIDEKLS